MSEDITIAIEQNGVIYENEKFVNFKLDEKDKEIERLNNIIKEVREEMKKYIELCVDITPNDILDLLDKVEENK